MKQHEYYVYILASKSGTLYIGVTNDLMRRALEHKAGKIPGFTKEYDCTRLVYFEDTDDVASAIEREKQLKKWRREKKENLIKTVNPSWKDLSEGWYDEWSEAPDYSGASYHSHSNPPFLSCHSDQSGGIPCTLGRDDKNARDFSTQFASANFGRNDRAVGMTNTQQ